MQFTTSILLAISAVFAAAAPSAASGAVVVPDSNNNNKLAARSNSLRLSTWTGTSCQGTKLDWTFPDGSSCTNFQSVTSLKVNNFGGCSTTYFTGSGCNNNDSPIHVGTQGSCDGYAQGERIGSVLVVC
ncbi:hypothetical protein F5Y17DRAFT_319367 [Xylariaceae sp. FL0594]|nr:hypothetical protein F5Y17DRAFT_319367 [Xylariaceae sp. FL0594]